jgi:CheY-like chemotaxis protein
MKPAVRVLVVDDNAINLELAKFALELEGFEVTTVLDAVGFEAALAVQTPDVVLMDIQLPGTDGLTLTRRLKADLATASIPVIAVTAYAMKGDEQRMTDAGCDGYISKPIDVAVFGKQVRKFLRT